MLAFTGGNGLRVKVNYYFLAVWVKVDFCVITQLEVVLLGILEAPPESLLATCSHSLDIV